MEVCLKLEPPLHIQGIQHIDWDIITLRENVRNMVGNKVDKEWSPTGIGTRTLTLYAYLSSSLATKSTLPL